MPVWTKPAAAAALLLCFALGAQAGNPGNTASFTDPNFSLQFPSTWVREPEPGPPQILRAQAPGGEVNLIIIADRSAGNVSSEDFASQNLQALKHVFGDQLKLEADEPMALKNTEGHLLVLAQELQGADDAPLKIKQHMVLFVAHGTGYAVTCTARADLYQNFEKTFQAISKSVAVTATAGDTAPDAGTKTSPAKE